MEILTRADLDLLVLTDPPGTRVSLFLPTHRLGSEDRTDPLRWKHLLTETEHALAEAGVSSADTAALLRPAWALHDDAVAWQYVSDGLAMFLSAGEPRSYRVAFPVPELAAVGDRFLVGPLLRALSRDSRFLVLTVSQRDVRLLEGTAERVEPVELHDVPTDLRDVLEKPASRSDSMARPVSVGGRGGRAVFYGSGAADAEWRKEEVHEFLQVVARGLDDLLAGQDLPLVLVGLPENLAAFRAVTGYRHVLDEEVRTNPDGLAADRLHELAWPLVEGLLAEDRRRALARLGERQGTGLATTDPDAVATAAAEGRVDTLFVAVEPSCWDDPALTGTALRLDGESPAPCALVDRAAVDTLTRSGQVHAVPGDELGTEGGLAATLRY